MRKIKFRVWDNHDQCWLNSFAIFYNGEFADMAKGVMHGDICQCDINYQKTPSHIIIEQFTGLYDKNGVEIYEGDIVKLFYYDGNKEDGLGKVKGIDNIIFVDGCFKLENETTKPPIGYDILEKCGFTEVIGNIHEEMTK